MSPCCVRASTELGNGFELADDGGVGRLEVLCGYPALEVVPATCFRVAPVGGGYNHPRRTLVGPEAAARRLRWGGRRGEGRCACRSAPTAPVSAELQPSMGVGDAKAMADLTVAERKRAWDCARRPCSAFLRLRALPVPPPQMALLGLLAGSAGLMHQPGRAARYAEVNLFRVAVCCAKLRQDDECTRDRGYRGPLPFEPFRETRRHR